MTFAQEVRDFVEIWDIRSFTANELADQLPCDVTGGDCRWPLDNMVRKGALTKSPYRPPNPCVYTKVIVSTLLKGWGS